MNGLSYRKMLCFQCRPTFIYRNNGKIDDKRLLISMIFASQNRTLDNAFITVEEILVPIKCDCENNLYQKRIGIHQPGRVYDCKAVLNLI